MKSFKNELTPAEKGGSYENCKVFFRCISERNFSRALMVQTPLGLQKYVRNRRSLSQLGLIIESGQEAQYGHLFYFLQIKVCCVYSLEMPH